jgi:K+-sensing histidine kinase KdpD
MSEKLAATMEAAPKAQDGGAGQSDDWGERVAHELRGPAGVTLGAIDELELALGAQAENHRALLAMARRGVGKVLRTAERLSKKSQLDSGRAVMAATQVDLRELVARAGKDAEQMEARRGIEVKVEAGDTPQLATLDESWALTAVTELVSLGIRAARREVRITLTREGERARVAVTDDGRPPASPVQSGHASPADRRSACLSVPLTQGIARALGAELTIDAAAAGNRRVLLFAKDNSDN